MAVQILPFHPGMLADAGTLLAERHRQHRLSFPELPKRFEDPATARAAVEAVWNRTHATGVAALDDGRLVGYLIGDMPTERREVWGCSAWVRLAGCAIAPNQSASLAAELYAALASRWVADGCFTHLVFLPVADPCLVQAWFALSFGIEQVYALLTLQDCHPNTSVESPGLEIRLATLDDRDTLGGMSQIIRRHLAQAPVWCPSFPEEDQDYRTGYASMVDDPTATVWLAFRQGQAVGFQAYFPTEPTGDDDLVVPAQCIELSLAGTVESARGRGIGRALTHHGLTHAIENEYRYCLADWRGASFLAGRFWPRRGFRPVAYRLARRLDTRIAWANGRVES